MIINQKSINSVKIKQGGEGKIRNFYATTNFVNQNW